MHAHKVTQRNARVHNILFTYTWKIPPKDAIEKYRRRIRQTTTPRQQNPLSQCLRNRASTFKSVEEEGFHRKTNLPKEKYKSGAKEKRTYICINRVESLLPVKYPSSMEAQCCSLLFNLPRLKIGCTRLVQKFISNASNNST